MIIINFAIDKTIGCGIGGFGITIMLTDIIPEIIEEPAKAGCAPGNETIGYLAGEISRLRSELRNIATAKPSEWGEMSDQFQPWAQNRARAALTLPNATVEPAAARSTHQNQ